MHGPPLCGPCAFCLGCFVRLCCGMLIQSLPMSEKRAYGQTREKPLVVRMTAGEKERVAKDASAAGMSISDYVRARVLPATSTPQALYTAANAGRSDVVLSLQNGEYAAIEKRLSSIEEAIRTGQAALGSKTDEED